MTRAPVSKETRVLLERERALQREKAAIKAERAAIEAEKAEARAIKEKYGKRPANAIEALTREGFSYADATKMVMNDSEPTPEMLARKGVDEVERLRQELASEKEQAAAQREADLNQQVLDTLEAHKQDIRDFTAAKAQDYELLNIFGAHDAVHHLVQQQFDETGRLLSLKEASDLVERHLQEQVAKAQATKKFQAGRQPGASEAGTKQPDKPGQTSASGRTVTNEFTTSTPTLVSSPQVEADRMQRALAALK
jgi:hypothetical protein